MVQFCSQLEAMQNMKEQLEQRTRMIETNIQRQQDELRQIQEELQRVQGQNLQVRLKSCSGACGKRLCIYLLKDQLMLCFFWWFLKVLLLKFQNLCSMFQMFLHKGAGGLNLSSVQMAQGNTVQQGGSLSMQGQVVSAGPLHNSIQQQHAVQPQSQQQTLLREQNTALAQVRKTKKFSFSPTQPHTDTFYS